MAISEACKFEIKEEVDKLVKKEGISKAEAIRMMTEFYKNIGISVSDDTIQTKYYTAQREENQTLLNKSDENQLENQEDTTKKIKTLKQTEPETKIKIKEVANEIKKGEVSDDDIKIVGDAIADVIKEGKAAPRVATKAATAVKKSLGKDRIVESKPIDNFDRLRKHALALQEGLQFWADGTMIPESEDEVVSSRIVWDCAWSIIVNYARLGIDVISIYETFYKGEKENERRKLQQDKNGV